MKITIVGAGWLGVPLAQNLCGSGMSVSLVYRSQKPSTTDEISLISMTDQQRLEQTLKTADSLVFCFPAPKDGSLHANHCLNFAKFTSENCRFIFTSTTGVYPNENSSFDENAVLDSSNKHVETEKLLYESLKDRLTIVRLAGLVDESRLPVRMMSASGKIYNGNEYCNLIHKQDAVGLISFLIQHKIGVAVVNACAPQHPKKGEYYSKMAEAIGVKIPQFEKGPTGKLIQSDLSLSLGYEYQKPDPYSFY